MIEVENVSKHFGGVKAVDHATLTIAKGSITGLIGPNGAGKTTLLRLLTGGVRTGLPTRRIKAGIAALSDGASLADVEDVWHALSPPYAALLDWIDGRGPRPDTRGIPTFTPLMHGTAIASPTPDPAPMIAE